MLRVLTLSTLFPNAVQPNSGIFVGHQTARLAAHPGVELQVVNPVALPPAPFDLWPSYRGLRAVPRDAAWRGLRVDRPRFSIAPGLSGAWNPGAVYRATRPVLRRLRAEGFLFDVIDAEFFYPDGPAAARLATEFGVPFSIKARGADIHYWGGRAACRRQILDAAARAGGLLAVAESLKRDMVAMGMEAGKIAVHYTGVDLGHFQPADRVRAKTALGVTGKLVASVGALIPRKGHDLVIDAMVELPGVTLLIAGAGPERGRLQAQVEARGLGARVRLLGSVAHAEVPGLLGAADAMALASDSEGLANAWVEALACGTPIVIPEVDGAAEVVDRPAAGRLLDARTPAAIADAIRAILAHPPEQGAVRASAERFIWERNTEALFRHLSGLKRS